MQRLASWKAAFQALFTRLYCIHSRTYMHCFAMRTILQIWTSCKCLKVQCSRYVSVDARWRICCQ